MDKLHLSEHDVEQWLDEIIRCGKQVVAPVRTGDRVEFDRITSAIEVATNYIQTVQSAKKVVFPETEVLFSYRKQAKDTVLQEAVTDTISETIVWKLRPCDVAGFSPLDCIFNWDYKDKTYNIRREKLILVSYSCTECDANCFCTSMKRGPGNTDGSDIQITTLPDKSVFVELLTEKGKALADNHLKSSSLSVEGIDKTVYLADVPVRFDSDSLRTQLSGAFDSPVWQQQSERCLGCGACAFVCPTCACFDLQEDAGGSSGRRVRCWDSCGFSLFTQHTSGHNPRPTQSTRWRQRILHKFSYMPERLGVAGCTGCGRCSRACPVDMNILEHLISIDHHE